MAIKLKNNHRTIFQIGALAVLVLSVINLCFFPLIHGRAQKLLEQKAAGAESLDVNAVSEEEVSALYQGAYVLFLEAQQNAAENEIEAADLFVDKEQYSKDWLEETGLAPEDASGFLKGGETDYLNLVNEVLQEWNTSFYENTYGTVDFCYSFNGATKSNTDQELGELFSGELSREEETHLKEAYAYYFVLSFAQNGQLDVKNAYGNNVEADVLIKAFQMANSRGILKNCFGEDFPYLLKGITSFEIAYGIRTENAGQLVKNQEYRAYYGEDFAACREAGADVLYVVSVAVLLLLVVFLTSQKFWNDKISYARPGKCYLMEAALLGILAGCGMIENYYSMIDATETTDAFEALRAGLSTVTGYDLLNLIRVLVFLWVIYAVWFLSIYFLRPVAALGLREYIRQYSLIYQIYPWLKEKWKKLVYEVNHIDFKEKSTKTMVKLVVINFVVLLVISMMWFFGIWALIVYSALLFYFMNRYYDRIRKDYDTLLRATSKIADGDLESEIVEDMGVFEPYKAELAQIRSGFKAAVEEETKSQRMKTELITNVSHDLKTPLTAITTYVELLKKEDLTEEERRSYVDTLEKKTLRLKMLIEDLFEVSKASSNNITLNLMDVDVVNLLKQVSVEHTEKFEQLGLDVRFTVPGEKVILQLDNQKTYRIFENLFVNIQKYAMPTSRVYVEVRDEDGIVRIILKNMSASAIEFSPEEITERFVRGDASRNTEGSGLGLAIAKSFTEAQKGSFNVEVDGDLFKVIICWKK